MKTAFIIISAISIIAEALVSFPFTLIIVSLFIVLYSESAAIFVAVAGILLDLFTLRPIGVSSLFFLILVLVSQRYRKKIYAGNIFFQLPFLVIALSAYSLIFYRNINLWYIGFMLLVTGVIYLLFRKYFPETDSKKRLTVE